MSYQQIIATTHITIDTIILNNVSKQSPQGFNKNSTWKEREKRKSIRFSWQYKCRNIIHDQIVPKKQQLVRIEVSNDS